MSAVLTNDETRGAGRARLPWDPWLVGAVTTLAALGLIMVYSASIDYATRVNGNSLYFFLHHAAYLFAGLVLATLVVRTRVRWWEMAGPTLLLIGLILLALVLVPGLG